MGALGVSYLTLADKLKRSDPDNRIAAIIEIAAETNEVLLDAIALEGNLPTGHRTTVRTGYPSGTWRKLYGGVVPTRSTTAQVDDSCGMLEAYAEVDKALADLNGNTNEFRLSESSAFIEGMNQDFCDVLFYGNTESTPEKFMGLSARYDKISTDATQSGYNIIDAGGTGSDNTSMWLVTWGANTCHLIYPKGSTGGLNHRDLGEVTAGDATNGYWQAYRDHFKWDCGLSLRDWRGVSRIANLDVSDMVDGTVTIEDYLIRAFYRTRRRPGKKALYANETVLAALHKRAKDKSNVQLDIRDFGGQPVVTFLGIPIRQVDALLNNETRVTA